MLSWLLNLAYCLLLAAASPWLVFRAITQGKYRAGWREKLLGQVPRRDADTGCIWLHAVSVGEVLQLQPVLDLLAVRCPGHEYVISTTTITAYELANKKYAAHGVIYFPLDFSWAARRALARIRPTVIVLVELELWPNFILAATDQSIPVLLINGRISERSFQGYRKIRPLISRLLRRMSVLAVQNETYAQRLCELGADPARVVVTGSIKFDRVETDRGNPRTTELRRAFGLDATDRVFIAGSTQDPEERYALEAYLALLPRHRDLRLILVPRHKERFEEVARLVTDTFGLPLLRRSSAGIINPVGRVSRPVSQTNTNDAGRGGPTQPASGTTPPVRLLDTLGERAHVARVSRPVDSHPPVLLLDTLGELAACWGLAEVAFVGGSLTSRGGQNMIEPAGYGAAVCFGPNTQNFRDVVDLLLQEDGAAVVSSSEALRDQVAWCLAHPEQAAARGDRARRLVLAQRGAAARTVDCIVSALPATCPENARAA